MEEPVPVTEFLAEAAREAVGPREAGGSGGGKPPRCRVVFVDKRYEGVRLPYWRVVRRGVYDGVRILYAGPPGCVLTPSTRIVYSEACTYTTREGESNIIVEEDCGTGKKHLYPYPRKVWEELMKFYIQPLAEGRRPFNVGVILMGPPGTGKSRLARIIAKYAGVNVFKIDTGILSKWIGESEGRLKETIADARASQPSIIILDDAEWILMSRSLAGDVETGMAEMRLSLQQILFDAMQEIYDKEESVLFVATTNVKQEVLDPALVRHGRFGPPIFVPLPDYEAARIIVREILQDKPEEEIDRIAFQAVNAGLSVADTIALAERVRLGAEARPRTVSGRGYARIYVDRVEEFRELERSHRIPLTRILSTRSRLTLYGPEDLAAAFAVQIAYAAGKTAIKLVDLKYLDEAMHSANMLGAVFIVPSRLQASNPAILPYYIHENTDTSVIFVGTTPVAIPTYNIGSTRYIIRMLGIEAAVKAVAAYKNVKISDRLMRKIKAKAGGDYEMAERILLMLLTTGIADEEYFESMLAWMQVKGYASQDTII